jgi:hypothetical protein
MSVRWEIDDKGLKDSPELFHKAMVRAVGQLMELAEQFAKREAPSSILRGDHGGRGGIVNRVDINGHLITGVLSATAKNRETGFNYALALYRGTGIYGPRKKMIVPVKKKILAWVTRGIRPTTSVGWREARKEGRAFFARKTKGIRPNLYLDKGMKLAMAKAPAIFDREIEKIMVA